MSLFYSESDIIKEAHSKTATFRLLSSDIVHIRYYENAEIGRDEQIENAQVLKGLAVKIKHPLLIEGGDFASFTKEGLDTVTELEKSAPILARAIVTKSLAQKLYVNFFKRLTSSIPMKTFENYDEAVNWLTKL